MTEGDPRQVRVSDAEREHVVGLLERAVGQGRIDLTEFGERTSTALAARTRAELNAVLVDLPGAVLPHSATREVLELRTGVGDLKRTGEWVVPATVRVRVGMGDALLDFTSATVTGATTAVEVSIGCGSATLVVPPGWTVDVDDAYASVGSVRDRTDRRAEPRTHHLVVRGHATVGDITVRHPRAAVQWWRRA